MYVHKKHARNYGKSKWDRDYEHPKVKQFCNGEWATLNEGYGAEKTHATVFRQVTCPECLTIARDKIKKDLDECEARLEKYSGRQDSQDESHEEVSQHAGQPGQC